MTSGRSRPQSDGEITNSLNDPEGAAVWSLMVGGVESDGSRLRTTCEARSAVTARTSAVGHEIARQSQHLLVVNVHLLQTFVRLARAREEALAAQLRLRQGRIAADMLQPGLFDHRAERRAIAQSRVLEEALGQCHARLDVLARLGAATPGEPVLRFAAFPG
jgi:hypothetical protein